MNKNIIYKNCINQLRFHFETEENKKLFYDFFNEHFKGDIFDDTAYFMTKVSFPKEEMNELYQKLPKKEDIDMLCLSVNWGIA